MKTFLRNLFTSKRSARRSNRKAQPSPHQQARNALFVEALEERQLLSTHTPIQVRQYYGFDRVVFVSPTKPFQVGDGRNTTIAIVDAYNDPNIRSDLTAFDTKYNLPAPPQLTIVNQSGGTTLPVSDPGKGKPG